MQSGGNTHAAPPPHEQNPEVHRSAAAEQVEKHAPQWSRSAITSTHSPPQHDSLLSQAFPQRPQFASSDAKPVHWPPQQTSPVPQEGPAPQRHTPSKQVSPCAQEGAQSRPTVQLPEMQVCPGSHWIPHPPQLDGSSSVFKQAEPQQLRPPGHAAPNPHRHSPSRQTSSSRHAGSHPATTHAPPSQSSSSLQVLPQAPQLDSRVCRSTHRPRQHVSPSRQAGPEPHRHSPVRQASPLGAQSTPQPPQWNASVRVSTQPPPQQVPDSHALLAHAGMHRPNEQSSSAPQSGTQSWLASTLDASEIEALSPSVPESDAGGSCSCPPVAHAPKKSHGTMSNDTYGSRNKTCTPFP